MIGIFSLRSIEVGTDTGTYLFAYRSVQSSTFEEILTNSALINNYFSVGWLLFTKLLSLISINEQTYLIYIIIIQVFFVSNFIKRQSSTPLFSLFIYIGLYYYFTSLNLMAQSLAISACYYALLKLERKKYAEYTLIILAATFFFHRTAIIFILVPLIKFIPNRTSVVNFASILLVFIGIILYLNPAILSSILSLYSDKYYNTVFFDSVELRLSYLIWLFRVIVILLNNMTLNKSESEDDKEKIKFNSIFLAVSILMGIVGSKIYIITRTGLYFELIAIVMYPRLIDKIFKEKYLAKIIFSCIILIYLMLLLNNNVGEIVPYILFWQKQGV